MHDLSLQNISSGMCLPPNNRAGVTNGVLIYHKTSHHPFFLHHFHPLHALFPPQSFPSTPKIIHVFLTRFHPHHSLLFFNFYPLFLDYFPTLFHFYSITSTPPPHLLFISLYFIHIFSVTSIYHQCHPILQHVHPIILLFTPALSFFIYGIHFFSITTINFLRDSHPLFF